MCFLKLILKIIISYCKLLKSLMITVITLLYIIVYLKVRVYGKKVYRFLIAYLNLLY